MRSSAEIRLADVLALPSVDQLDAVLRTARLSVDERSRTILNNGFIRIRHECARWEAARQQPDLGKAFGEISEAADRFLKVVIANDARRQAVSTMESGTVWRDPIQSSFELLNTFHEAAAFYHSLYGYEEKNSRQTTDHDNILLEQFYYLFAEIKGTRPGNTYLLYDFTINCAELLGIKIGFVTPDAFRMRVKRMLDKQYKAFGSLAMMALDLPPVTFDQLSDEPRPIFGNMPLFDQDMSWYWREPKRGRNKR
jgi:hypothetical protein